MFRARGGLRGLAQREFGTFPNPTTQKTTKKLGGSGGPLFGPISNKRPSADIEQASSKKPRLRYRAEAFQKGAGNGARESQTYVALVKEGRRLGWPDWVGLYRRLIPSIAVLTIHMPSGERSASSSAQCCSQSCELRSPYLHRAHPGGRRHGDRRQTPWGAPHVPRVDCVQRTPCLPSRQPRPTPIRIAETAAVLRPPAIVREAIMTNRSEEGRARAEAMFRKKRAAHQGKRQGLGRACCRRTSRRCEQGQTEGGSTCQGGSRSPG